MQVGYSEMRENKNIYLYRVSLYSFLMKKYSLFFFASIITAPSFAIDTVQKATPFTNAPWCHIPCIKIRYIV